MNGVDLLHRTRRFLLARSGKKFRSTAARRFAMKASGLSGLNNNLNGNKL